jgi:ATP-binding cassette subfamily C protein LapB
MTQRFRVWRSIEPMGFSNGTSVPVTASENPLSPAAHTEKSSFVDSLREDLLHHDPLLACLVELTRFHGCPSTRAALFAGLPLNKGCLSPSLFARPATRAERSSKIVRRSLNSIDTACCQ